jgi:hypothetical protein
VLQVTLPSVAIFTLVGLRFQISLVFLFVLVGRHILVGSLLILERVLQTSTRGQSSSRTHALPSKLRGMPKGKKLMRNSLCWRDIVREIVRRVA